MTTTNTRNLCKILVFAGALLPATYGYAHGNDDPLLTRLLIDKFEFLNDDNIDSSAFEADLWSGYDLNKLWLKIEAERTESETEAAELQVLYSRGVSAYWDIQAGLRHDFEPSPERSWGVIGIHGLAPYFFEIDAALFIGESGRSAARFEAEYELLLTQRWILEPSLELNFFGQNDEQTATGSGLANSEFGLRLRYEIKPELAPYFGIQWKKHYGNTADFVEASGEDADSTQWLAGIRFWF